MVEARDGQPCAAADAGSGQRPAGVVAQLVRLQHQRGRAVRIVLAARGERFERGKAAARGQQRKIREARRIGPSATRMEPEELADRRAVRARFQAGRNPQAGVLVEQCKQQRIRRGMRALRHFGFRLDLEEGAGPRDRLEAGAEHRLAAKGGIGESRADAAKIETGG